MKEKYLNLLETNNKLVSNQQFRREQEISLVRRQIRDLLETEEIKDIEDLIVIDYQCKGRSELSSRLNENPLVHHDSCHRYKVGKMFFWTGGTETFYGYGKGKNSTRKDYYKLNDLEDDLDKLIDIRDSLHDVIDSFGIIESHFIQMIQDKNDYLIMHPNCL